MPHKDPFVTGQHDGVDIGAVTVADRQHRMKTFTRSQCMDALFLDEKKQYLQGTVRAAIARRLRALEKADLAQIRAGAGAA